MKIIETFSELETFKIGEEMGRNAKKVWFFV